MGIFCFYFNIFVTFHVSLFMSVVSVAMLLLAPPPSPNLHRHTTLSDKGNRFEIQVLGDCMYG